MLNEQTDALRLTSALSLFTPPTFFPLISETVEGNVAHARSDVEAGTKDLAEANKRDQFSTFCFICYMYIHFLFSFFKRVYNLLIVISQSRLTLSRAENHVQCAMLP